MQIGECFFDLPIYMISSGNSHACIQDPEKGKYLCLFTEQLFAERLPGAKWELRPITEDIQLKKVVEILDRESKYAGVCFDLQQTAEGPKSKFAFDWAVFKDAVGKREV